MATRKTKTKRPADFGDEDAVLAEVAAALDAEPDDFRIAEDRGLTSFGEGIVYRITSRHPALTAEDKFKQVQRAFDLLTRERERKEAA